MSTNTTREPGGWRGLRPHVRRLGLAVKRLPTRRRTGFIATPPAPAVSLVWRSPTLPPALATAAAVDPKVLAARPGDGTIPARLVGRVFWAAPDAAGTSFRLLAESPDGTGECVTVDARADGYPFGEREPLALPGHAVAVAGVLRWEPDRDRRGPFTRLWLDAALVDRRPSANGGTESPAAGLRRRFDYVYAFNARERQVLRDYRYDAAARTLTVEDWTAAGPGLAYSLARGLHDDPRFDVLDLSFYDLPQPPAGDAPTPRRRFRARFRTERLRGVKWEQAYPATLRLFAEEWDQPRGLGGQDFRGLGGF